MTQFSLTEQWQKLIPIEIPPLWQVIYYEGIHGHHILFHPDDIREFSHEPSSGPRIAPAQKVKKELAETGFQLLKSRSFREMTHIIDSLEKSDRGQIFRLYKSWLSEIKCRIKETAN